MSEGPSAASIDACLATLSLQSSLTWHSAGGIAAREATVEALVVALETVPLATLATVEAPLTTALQSVLLDGQDMSVGCFAAACECVRVVVLRSADNQRATSAIASALLPLLIDWCGCTGPASLTGAHAHVCACAVLPHVSAQEVVPVLLNALALPTAPPAARQRLAHQLLLALLMGVANADGGGLRTRLVAAAVRALCELLRDVRAGTRAVARQALLVLMEQAPRTATESFSRLPLRTQRQLAACAKQRALSLGPPTLPSPPLPPPLSHAVLCQAACRGFLARRRARAAAAFYTSLSCGVPVHIGGYAGVVAFVGKCEFSPGPWVGVALRLPVGKHDGAHKGTRYFTCAPRSGILVRPTAIAPLSDARRARATGHSARRLAPCAALEADGATGHRSSAAEHARRSNCEACGIHAPPPCVQGEASQRDGEASQRDGPPAPRPAPPAASQAQSDVAAHTSSECVEQRPATPLRTLLASHRGALKTMGALCDGQMALIRQAESAARLRGEEPRAGYLAQMAVLSEQQRLLASQLCDALRSEKGARGAGGDGSHA